MIFVYSGVDYITYVPIQISCRVPLRTFASGNITTFYSLFSLMKYTEKGKDRETERKRYIGTDIEKETDRERERKSGK